MLIDALLVLVLILALFVALSMLAHIWIQVPFVPTHKNIAKKMVELADLKEGHVVYDLGAGDGRILVEAKRHCPGVIAIGYEFTPSVWLWGCLYVWCAGVDVSMRRGNAFAQDISDADVIFLYLFPEVIAKLETKFDAELQRGTRVISHAFKFPTKTPIGEEVVQVGRREKKVFVYEW